MARCAPSLPLRPLALSVALSCLVAQAHADSISASATYSYDGAATATLSQTAAAGSVDVLEFQPGWWVDSSRSAIGIHTYGSSDGNFGSRSSGQGVYDVTGQFVIEKTITNTTGVLQNVVFNFDITPGTLSNTLQSGFAGTDFVSAGLLFDIRRDGNQVWNSGATLTTTAAGTTYTQSGVNLYSAVNGGGSVAATSYSVNGGYYTVDMGQLAAGESLTLKYTLSTFARGSAVGSGSYTTPEQTIVVPDRTHFMPGYSYECWSYDGESCDFGYGEYGGPILATSVEVAQQIIDMPIEEPGYLTCGYGYYTEGTGSCITVKVPDRTYTEPGYTYTIPAQTFTDAVSGSMASSGDPFDFNYYTPNQPGVPYGQLGSRASLSMVAAVPEPQTYLMMLVSLGVLGWTFRQKGRSA